MAMRIRTVLRLLLAIAYGLAGILHLARPGGFLAITPAWVPWSEQVVALTGIAEIAGAIGLASPWPRLRRAAGIGLALYAVCVFPANINHAVNAIPLGGTTLGWAYHGPRLAAQPLFVWLALWASEAIDWPFARPRGPTRQNGRR